jgi:hypothetical protein
LGRPTAQVVPKAIHDELVKRKMSRAHDLLRDNLYSAVAVLVDIAKDEEAQDSDRIKAAQLIIERVMGKTPERVQLSVAPPWAVALETLILASGQTELMEGEVIEVDGSDDEDG